MVKINKRIAFYILMTVLILLVLARYAFFMDIPRLVITGIIVMIALMGDRNEILAIAMCCIPLHEAVDFYTAIAICGALLIVKTLSSVRVGASVILVITMIVWELLHCLLINFDLRLLIVSLIPLIFLAIVLCFDMSDIDYVFVVRSMAVVSVSACAFCLMNAIVEADFNFSAAIANLQRLGIMANEDTLLGGRINPNGLGIVNILSITGLLQLRSMGMQKKVDYMLIVMLLIFGGMTASRTFLVCLLLMVFLMILGYQGDMRKKIKFIFALLIFVAVAMVLFNWMFPTALEYYVGRFQEEDITTGRYGLLRVYHEYITTHNNVMFFGVGLNNYANRLVNDYNVASNIPHNSVQEIILAWGLPGFVMFILLMALIIVEARKYNRQLNLLNFIPFVIVWVKSLAGQLLTSHYTMLALSLAYLSFCQNFNSESNSNQKDSQQF